MKLDGLNERSVLFLLLPLPTAHSLSLDYKHAHYQCDKTRALLVTHAILWIFPPKSIEKEHELLLEIRSRNTKNNF